MNPEVDGQDMCSFNYKKEITKLYFVDIVLKLNEIHGEKATWYNA